MRYFISAIFVTAVVFACNWCINQFYASELENVPNCEAAQEVYDRKSDAKLNLVWLALVCGMIADKFIF